MILLPEILDDMILSPKALRAYVELLFDATRDDETFTTACYRWDHDINDKTLSGIHQELYQRGMVNTTFQPLPPEEWEWRPTPANTHPLTVGVFALEIQPVLLNVDTPTFRLWLHALRMAQTQRSGLVMNTFAETNALARRLAITFQELNSAHKILVARQLLPLLDTATQAEE